MAPPETSFRFRLTWGTNSKEFEGSGPFLLGRSPDVAFVVKHEAVSRRHAELRVHDGALWITDLKSANGSSLDGAQLAAGQETRVPDGSTVSLGDHAVAIVVETFGSASETEESGTKVGLLKANPPSVFQAVELDNGPRPGSSGAEHRDLMQELKKLDAKRSSLQFEVKAVQAQIKTLSGNRANIEKEIAVLQEEQVRIQGEIDNKNGELLAIPQKLEAAEATLVEANQRADRAKAEADDAERQSIDLSKRLETLRQQESLSRAKIADAEHRFKTIFDEADAAKKQVSDAELALKEAREDTAKLKAEIVGLHSQKSEIGETIVTNDRELANLRKAIDRDKLEMESLAIATSEARVKKTQLDTEIQQLSAKKTTAEAELNSAQAEIEKVKQLVATMTADVRAGEKKVQEQKDLVLSLEAERLRIERARTEFEQVKSARDEELRKLAAEIQAEKLAAQEAIEAKRKLQLEQEQLGVRKAVAESELAAVRKDIDGIQKRMEATAAQVAAGEQTIRELKAAIADAEAERVRAGARGKEAQEQAELREQELQKLLGHLDQAKQDVAAQSALMRKMKADQEVDASEARSKKAQLEAEFQQLLAKRATTDSELTLIRVETAKLEARNQALHAEMTATEKSIQDGKAALAAVKSETLRVSKDREEAVSRCESLQSEASGIAAELKKKRDEAFATTTAECKRLEVEAAEWRKSAEEYAKKVREEADAMRVERKKALDLEMAELKVRAMAQEEDRRKQEEREKKILRKRDADNIARQLQDALLIQLKGTPELSTKLPAIVPGLVNDVMFPSRDEADVSVQAAALLATDVDSQERAKRYWLKLGIAAAVVVVAVFVRILSPGFYGGVARGLASLILNEESNSQAYVKRIQDERANRPKYDPPQDSVYKDNFTDNVVRTVRYVEMKENQDLRKKWILELNKFFLDELKLREGAIVQFAASETLMVGELVRLRQLINPSFEKEGLARMREAEKSGVEELKGVIGEKNYPRLREFEEAFYRKYLEAGS